MPLHVDSKNLYHVSSYADLFDIDKKPIQHKVVFFKSSKPDEKPKFSSFMSLVLKLIKEGRDIVFATKDSEAISRVNEYFIQCGKKNSNLSPLSLLRSSSIKLSKESINSKENKNPFPVLYNFTLKSNELLKNLEASGNFAREIASSDYVGITPLPVRKNIEKQLSLIESRVEALLKTARTTPHFQETVYTPLLSHLTSALKACKDSFHMSETGDSYQIPVRLPHPLFYTLYVSIMKLFKNLSQVELNQPEVNFHTVRLEQIMNPKLQPIWSEKSFCFVVAEENPSYYVYTDASVIKRSQGSFAGVLTLETGHIIQDWSYRLSETITDANTVELLAIIYALCQVRNLSNRIVIQTDSEIAIDTLLNYSISGKVTFHLQNNPLLFKVFSKLPRIDNIHIQHVKSHSDCAGNIFVDKAAAIAHVKDNCFNWERWASEMLRYLDKSTTKKSILTHTKQTAPC